MEILLWIIFGGLAGWIASLMMNTDGQQGIILNIVVGIIGAFIGGYAMQFFGFGGVSGFDLYSFFIAVLGAVILLSVVKLVRN